MYLQKYYHPFNLNTQFFYFGYKDKQKKYYAIHSILFKQNLKKIFFDLTLFFKNID
jgi:hypothetical protein